MTPNYPNPTIGCDPELFLYDTKHLKMLSAHDIITADKTQPEPVLGGAIQHDGLALEFNINPAKTLKEFLESIQLVMSTLETRIKTHSPDFEFEIVPSHKFPLSYVKTLPKTIQVLGCQPDYNAYTGKINPSPVPPVYDINNEQYTLRTAAGHIHIGWTEDQEPHEQAHFNDCILVTKQLDIALGAVAPLWDDDRIRSTLYGRKGAFRPKTYGVEYRVLSNRWLISRPLTAWIYLATMRAMTLLDEGVHLTEDSMMHIMSPKLVHNRLVRHYGFPPIPH